MQDGFKNKLFGEQVVAKPCKTREKTAEMST